MECAAICSAVPCGTLWLASPFPQSPRDVEKMKKTGSHSGWCTDTAARKEVKEIRVHSTLHKFFLNSGHQTQNFPIILKVAWLFDSLFWGGGKIMISRFQILTWIRKFKEGKETSKPWGKREICKSPPLPGLQIGKTYLGVYPTHLKKLVCCIHLDVGGYVVT